MPSSERTTEPAVAAESARRPVTARRRRGRRPSGADTRAALLAAARKEFAERGFDGATVRRIAESAGVDPAMVNHWFGSKEALFTAALEMPVDPTDVLETVLGGDPDELGKRIVLTFLRVWDAAGGGPMIALIRSVAGHPEATWMLRQFIIRLIVGRLVAAVAPDRHEERAALCASQIVGLGLVRYVVELEPLASADHAIVAAAIGPTLQRYLTGPID